jgi:glyoxylase-like metal-dependent hydrolase (beta-lactamase superfamily II)
MHRANANSTILSLSVLRAAVLGLVLAVTAGAAAPADAPATAAGTGIGTGIGQAPGYYRLALGTFQVVALSDGTIDLPVDQLLKQPPEKTRAALKRDFIALPAETSVNAFLIDTGTKLVLVDTGAGALFGPTLGRLVESLRAAGRSPEQVTDIVITHMHGDHVGGLVADGKVVFPNAVVHADQHDADYWLSQANLDKAPDSMKDFFRGAMASINPYVAAGHFQPIKGDGEIVPGVRSEAAYGHTPGHTVYVVESQGQRLVLVGDLIHVGAVQFPHPEVTIQFDSDPKAAAASRAKVFQQAAKEGAWVGAAHIAFPGIGHLRANGKGWDWVPVNYTENRPVAAK